MLAGCEMYRQCRGHFVKLKAHERVAYCSDPQIRARKQRKNRDNIVCTRQWDPMKTTYQEVVVAGAQHRARDHRTAESS